MSKCKTAILDIMSCGHWMTSNQIAAAVGYPKPTVKASLNNMHRTGLALKKDPPDRTQLVLWKKSELQSGFGVSESIAAFDRCLQAVRQ